MKTVALSSIFSVLMGSVIVINGVAVNIDDVLKDARKAVNGANLHQLATVLEIYYLDHNEYPDVNGGKALIDLFEHEGYILNRPIDPNVFSYKTENNGQNYSLKLKKG